MNGPLNEGAVGELLELVQPNKPASLPILWLVTELSASGVVQKAVASYPVYQRSGGFMVAVPALEEVKNFLDAVSGGDDGEAASHQVEVELVTNRGRLLGRVDCFLVDLPWAFLGHFQRVPRGASAPQFEVVHFSLGGTQGKPSVKSVRTAADNWIGQGMDDTTAQDYFTGEELEPQDTGDDEELQPEAAPTTGTPPADVTSLETQIKQLQRELAHRHDLSRPAMSIHLEQMLWSLRPRRGLCSRGPEHNSRSTPRTGRGCSSWQVLHLQGGHVLG